MRISRQGALAAFAASLLLATAALAPAQTPVVEYLDGSTDTGIQFTGQPRNAAAVDYNDDGKKDLIITRVNGDGNAMAWRCGSYSANDVPQFQNYTLTVFPSNSGPGDGTAGIIVADYDNDGWTDFFAPNPFDSARLYRNASGSQFTDWTGESDLDTVSSYALDHALMGSWGDYDGDGYVDLTMIYGYYPDAGENDVLVLHNQGGTFDATAPITGGFAGNSPMWADFDGDGDLDLLVLRAKEAPVGPPDGYYTYFYINQGDGSFAEEAGTRIGDQLNPYAAGRIATAVDIDNDGDLDVAFAESWAYGYLENDAPENPGAGYFTVRYIDDPSLQHTPTDLAVMDFDRDGYQDVLFGDGVAWNGSYSNPTEPYLLANQPAQGGGRTLVDVADLVGLQNETDFRGFAAADWKRDGYTDLYLSRVTTAPFFFKGKAAAGQSQNTWLGIALSSPYGGNNTAGLGATVELTSPITQAQVVDGGSGLASQHDADLIFGLGTYSGSVQGQVHWPNGLSQTFTIDAGQLDSYATITDSSPVVDDATVQGSLVYHVSTGLLDWVFTWQTHNESESQHDKVVFDLTGVPPQCQPPAAELTPSTEDVTHVMAHFTGDRWRHTLILHDVPCVAICSLPFTVESGKESYRTTSTEHPFKISTCPQSF